MQAAAVATSAQQTEARTTMGSGSVIAIISVKVKTAAATLHDARVTVDRYAVPPPVVQRPGPAPLLECLNDAACRPKVAGPVLLAAAVLPALFTLKALVATIFLVAAGGLCFALKPGPSVREQAETYLRRAG